MKRHYRSVFLSDIHLGYQDCKAELLLAALQDLRTERLFLLGDILDLWAIQRFSHWHPSHSAVLNRLRELAAAGTRITYIPGNHDAALRDFTGELPAGIQLCHELVHTTANGQRLLLIHGDQFDQVIHCAPLLYWLGDRAYDLLLFINRWHFRLCHWRAKPYWSLAGLIKSRIGKARELIANYQKLALGHARERQVDGVVCGHIHHPQLTTSDGLIYANCGDWVENCTLLAEHRDGQLELLNFAQGAEHRRANPQPLQKAA